MRDSAQAGTGRDADGDFAGNGIGCGIGGLVQPDAGRGYTISSIGNVFSGGFQDIQDLVNVGAREF